MRSVTPYGRCFPQLKETSNKNKSKTLVRAVKRGFVQSELALQRAVLIWHSLMLEERMLPDMVCESLRMLRWQKGLLTLSHFTKYCRGGFRTVSDMLEWWQTQAQLTATQQRCIIAELAVSSAKSEAELEVSALRAELYLNSCQSMLQTAESRSNLSAMDQERREWSHERQLLETQLQQAEEEKALVAAELTSLKEFLSSSTSYTPRAVPKQPEDSESKSRQCALLGTDLDTLSSSTLTMSSPARLRREKIAMMTEAEILALAMREMEGEFGEQEAQDIKEEAVAEDWLFGGPPLKMHASDLSDSTTGGSAAQVA